MMSPVAGFEGREHWTRYCRVRF